MRRRTGDEMAWGWARPISFATSGMLGRTFCLMQSWHGSRWDGDPGFWGHDQCHYLESSCLEVLARVRQLVSTQVRLASVEHKGEDWRLGLPIGDLSSLGDTISYASNAATPEIASDRQLLLGSWPTVG